MTNRRHLPRHRDRNPPAGGGGRGDSVLVDGYSGGKPAGDVGPPPRRWRASRRRSGGGRGLHGGRLERRPARSRGPPPCARESRASARRRGWRRRDWRDRCRRTSAPSRAPARTSRSVPGWRLAEAAIAEAALQRGAEIGDDVAEHVVGDDHVEALGLADQLHRQGVDEEVAGLDLRILGGHLVEAPLPEIVAVAHDVRLVGHADLARLVRSRVFERGADDPLHPLAGVDLLLDARSRRACPS